MTAPNILSLNIAVMPHVQNGNISHAPEQKASVKTEAHSHPIIVSPNHGTSFVSPFWCPEFGGGFYIFEKKVYPWK
jgi:hypothetical protein